ncbi:MAG TPA: class I SAM-dependent methyltransferase [Anaerolineales bacterium]|nr:class I SAM-dependent methyltransferase [Anaerolineales bacterium]
MKPDRLFAQEIIEDILEQIHGRLCLEASNCNFLAQAVSEARSGHHLEIGTLHGGSAILAALVKAQHGYSGDVWCVDPLEGYYKGTPFACEVDWVSKIPVTPEIVIENLRTFGVEDRVHIIQAKSDPLPTGLPDVFSSAFIDGDHWGDAPLRDWMNVKDKVTGYVIFDNTDQSSHPAVVQAVNVARADPDWEVVLEAGITAVLKRRVP